MKKILRDFCDIVVTAKEGLSNAKEKLVKLDKHMRSYFFCYMFCDIVKNKAMICFTKTFKTTSSKKGFMQSN